MAQPNFSKVAKAVAFQLSRYKIGTDCGGEIYKFISANVIQYDLGE